MTVRDCLMGYEYKLLHQFAAMVEETRSYLLLTQRQKKKKEKEK